MSAEANTVLKTKKIHGILKISSHVLLKSSDFTVNRRPFWKMAMHQAKMTSQLKNIVGSVFYAQFRIRN
jgi:hypothetical protein